MDWGFELAISRLGWLVRWGGLCSWLRARERERDKGGEEGCFMI